MSLLSPCHAVFSAAVAIVVLAPALSRRVPLLLHLKSLPAAFAGALPVRLVRASFSLSVTHDERRWQTRLFEGEERDESGITGPSGAVILFL